MKLFSKIIFILLFASTVYSAPYYRGEPTKVIGWGSYPNAFYLNNDLYIFYGRNVDFNISGDQIWLKKNYGDPIQVMTPSLNLLAPDSMHSANPAVVKNTYPEQYWGFQYLMYYECAPKLHNYVYPFWGDGVYNEVCLAGSNDLIHWSKFKDPIIKFPQSKKDYCNQIVWYDRWLWDWGKEGCEGPMQNVDNYGPGHPSIIVHTNDLIELYYYNDGYTWRAFSWDYVNLWGHTRTNMVGAWKMRYNQTENIYIATTAPDLKNTFVYSKDGINFSSYCSMPNRLTKVPGQGSIYQPSIISDEWGRVYSWSVPFISPEGTWLNRSTSDWNLYLFEGSFIFDNIYFPSKRLK